MFLPDKRFTSLAAAFDFILKEYASRSAALLWSETDSGLLTPNKVPQYLFRGECGAFGTTKSGIFRPDTYRVENGRLLSTPDLETLERLIRDLARRFTDEDDYSLKEHEAIGLLQHYGLPTWMIDFTGHAGHAFAFAAAGEAQVGRVAVMSSCLAAAERGLVDLTEHPWAERPRRQAAFGVIAPSSRDLKSDEARSRLNIRWYEFPVSSRDRAYLKDRYANLVSLSDDPSAGFLRFHITEYVEAKGKFSPALTEWLLKRVPAAPRCYRVKEFEAKDVVVNHCGGRVLPVAFDESTEVGRSRLYWSSAHKERGWDRMKNWSWPGVGSVVADPRTYHPDYYPG